MSEEDALTEEEKLQICLVAQIDEKEEMFYYISTLEVALDRANHNYREAVKINIRLLQEIDALQKRVEQLEKESETRVETVRDQRQQCTCKEDITKAGRHKNDCPAHLQGRHHQGWTTQKQLTAVQ